MLGSVLAADPFLLLALVAVRVGLTSPDSGVTFYQGQKWFTVSRFVPLGFARHSALQGARVGGGWVGGVVITVRVVVVVARGGRG